MSKKLENKIKQVFENKPTVNKVYSTSDNKVFIIENRAKLHASTLKDKTVNPHLRSTAKAEEKQESKETETPINAKDLAQFAKDSSDLSALQEMLAKEKALEKPRVTAVNALEARIKELSDGSIPEGNSELISEEKSGGENQDKNTDQPAEENQETQNEDSE